MGKKEIFDGILPEAGYEEKMRTVVEPYLAERRTEGFCQREEGKRIFYVRCLADCPKGVVVISHGYTETIEKYAENIYYFLQEGYHVWMHEHCGHGRSYRLFADGEEPYPVYVDDYKRYVEDLLLVCRMAAGEFPELPLFLYGHSMGGGIGAAAVACAPELFSGLLLSSPMLRPNSGSVPWVLGCLMAGAFCLAGKKRQYLPGNHPYDGKERFEDSASGSEARFRYYKEKKDREPLFQMSGSSYGWLWQAVRLNRFLQGQAVRRISCPTLVLQAERETYVSNPEQEKFVKKLNRQNGGKARLIRIDGAKHEIFNGEKEQAERYWGEAFSFLERCGEEGCKNWS